MAWLYGFVSRRGSVWRKVRRGRVLRSVLSRFKLILAYFARVLAVLSRFLVVLVKIARWPWLFGVFSGDGDGVTPLCRKG